MRNKAGRSTFYEWQIDQALPKDRWLMGRKLDTKWLFAREFDGTLALTEEQDIQFDVRSGVSYKTMTDVVGDYSKKRPVTREEMLKAVME